GAPGFRLWDMTARELTLAAVPAVAITDARDTVQADPETTRLARLASAGGWGSHLRASSTGTSRRPGASRWRPSAGRTRPKTPRRRRFSRPGDASIRYENPNVSAPGSSPSSGAKRSIGGAACGTGSDTS